MAFEVSDLPGQPLLCCNRTLADHCVAFVPLVDRLFTSCTVVHASAHPAWAMAS